MDRARLLFPAHARQALCPAVGCSPHAPGCAADGRSLVRSDLMIRPCQDMASRLGAALIASPRTARPLIGPASGKRYARRRCRGCRPGQRRLVLGPPHARAAPMSAGQIFTDTSSQTHRCDPRAIPRHRFIPAKQKQEAITQRQITRQVRSSLPITGASTHAEDAESHRADRPVLRHRRRRDCGGRPLLPRIGDAPPGGCLTGRAARGRERG